MKIRKLFKRAAAFALAAVTALSVLPATTAFAAGDIGTISFQHTYDSSGNAIRYNSSATINGYTAGGAGHYHYRMFVDGETAFCIQPGVPLKTGNTLKKASSDTWNALSSNQRKAVGLALLYGYQGNSGNLSGTDDEKWIATQTLVWEFVTGCREATGSYGQTSQTVYNLQFGSNYANSGSKAVYDQIVSLLSAHNTIPSFMSGSANGSTKELSYKDGKYSLTLTDSNGVLSDYTFTSSDSGVSVSKSGNTLTISSAKAVSGSVRITATRNNTPTVSSSAKMIAYGDPDLQDVVTGVENADSVKAYLNVETPTGTLALKKTSEDGVVSGISFTIKGDGFNKTVTTDGNGNLSVEGLFPGTYTATEQSIDRYEEWFITDYDCFVDGLYDKLGEYENLDELNYLASKLDEMSGDEYERFQAAMEVGDHSGSIQEIINLTENLDCYDIYSGIHDHDDLGRYYIEELDAIQVPEHLRNYIDYEAYGRDVALEEGGEFTTTAMCGAAGTASTRCTMGTGTASRRSIG